MSQMSLFSVMTQKPSKNTRKARSADVVEFSIVLSPDKSISLTRWSLQRNGLQGQVIVNIIPLSA